MTQTRVHTSIARIRGRGIEVRHSRLCRSPSRSRCSCDPGFRAWVYDAAKRKKLRRSFRSEAEALAWRREQLRRIYDLETPKAGRLDVGYAAVRKALAELDAALPSLASAQRGLADDAIAGLYRAEDALLEILRVPS